MLLLITLCRRKLCVTAAKYFTLRDIFTGCNTRGQHLIKPFFFLQLTFDSTSALWSFCRSRAAAFVSSLRAAMWSAGRRTFPFVSFSSNRETTWSWPCCKATARGVKPSCNIQWGLSKHVPSFPGGGKGKGRDLSISNSTGSNSNVECNMVQIKSSLQWHWNWSKVLMN